MAKADKTKKNGDRSTTSLNINKEDVEQFNQLKAKETGRHVWHCCITTLTAKQPKNP